MQDVIELLRKTANAGEQAVIGRVLEVQGFSTLATDPLVAIGADGVQRGDLLGRPGAKQLRGPAAEMLASKNAQLRTVSVDLQGKDVAEVGLACGGRAEVLLQTAASIPAQLWELLASRAPAALLTRIEGRQARPDAMVVDRSGQSWGTVGGDTNALADAAMSALRAGKSGTQRLTDEEGVVLLETWVPQPRLVVLGSGELVGAIRAQAGLLGWEVQADERSDSLEGALDWSGATGALVVLSHDPHLDAPALALGLARGVPYVGALGSRATQSRRVDRLRAMGVADGDIQRIHRPIGLDLGGRRSPEVALAIVAEILASHHGRDARPLAQRSGPIHG